MSQQLALTPRTQHPPRWALGLFALALIAAVSLLFHWLDIQDPQDKVSGTPASFSRPEGEPRPPPEERVVQRPQEPPPPPVVQLGPITELNLLLEASSEEELVGRQVVLDEVAVQEVVGNYTFWVGMSAEARVPVVLLGELTQRQPELQARVRQGQQLRIFGFVRRMRDAGALEGADVWLSPRELEALRQERFFISALRVVPLEQ